MPGETNIPDRKNYDIAELGLSVEAARNLYTGRVNTEVVNLLLENARFAELTYRMSALKLEQPMQHLERVITENVQDMC